MLAWMVGALSTGPVVAAVPLQTEALMAIVCPLPPPSVDPTSSDSQNPHLTPGAAMTAPLLPTPSVRLDTLDVVRIGLSLDVYRQGQVWAQLQAQNSAQPQALHVGTALPMDPKEYPIVADAKDMAWRQRKANALELALQGFPERWPIPTLTVVRDYDPNAENLDTPPERVSKLLSEMANDGRSPAGMHWHQIRQLQPGAICNDTPEDVVEYLFRLFEANPDMPAMLVYSVEGYNIADVLSQRGKGPIGVGTGPRQPGELTDAVVALIVARPERLDWLRAYAPYTQVNPRNDIDPAFTGWKRQPPDAFRPTPSFPAPVTVRGMQQWDQMRVLAKLHRPVQASLLHGGEPGKVLKGEARHSALAGAWQQAIAGVAEAPARVFFDTGRPNGGLTDLAPALMAARSTLDPLDSAQSYDLTQRLGDTGASSPFVGIALATMASYLNADTSVVMPLRRDDRATVIAISSATPGRKPAGDPFGVKLRSQHSSLSAAPSPEFTEYFATLMQQSQRSRPEPARYMDPAKVALEQRLLDDFIASGPSVDLSDPTSK
ncbi:DUF2875 family protein [Achromobacter sp. NPDC058515]|uniref:type VI lipase adapter Tla3 domain-containing protein n=1 Tax=Achromobacter sp. NPDC058515 TaxID=3346533 RepID=UPI00365FB4C1